MWSPWPYGLFRRLAGWLRGFQIPSNICPYINGGGLVTRPAQETTVQKYEEKAEQPKVFVKSFGRMAENVYFCSVIIRNL